MSPEVDDGRVRAEGTLPAVGLLALLVVSVGTCVAGVAQAQAPTELPSEPTELVCELTQGGQRQTLDVLPTSDPYRVASVAVGKFAFKAVWVPVSDRPAYLKLYTYADSVLLHQASFAPGKPSGDLWDTGWQRVYAPGLGRELTYRCHGLVQSEQVVVRPEAAPSSAVGGASASEASPVTPMPYAPAVSPVPPMSPMSPMSPVPKGHPRSAGSVPSLARPLVSWDGDTVPGPEVVQVALVGDVLLDDGPGRLIRSGRDPFAPFAAWLARADVRVGNLECVVARGGRADPAKPFSFRAHPRVLPVLARHLDVVGLANNHSGDYGPQAFAEMLGLLKRHGVSFFGGGLDLEQAHQPLIIERRGVRIALLGYNEFMPRRFEADVGRPGIAWSEDEQVWRDIQQARSLADVVIPVMHWGQEHEPQANERQRRLARLMIDAGAHAVVGGHPHVTQDVEIYEGRPIVYSLGNFLFDGFKDADNNTAWLLDLQLDRDGVRSLRVVTGHIDRKGTPHPKPDLESPCWSRGQSSIGTCRGQVF